jgi:hypothetical protein
MEEEMDLEQQFRNWWEKEGAPMFKLESGSNHAAAMAVARAAWRMSSNDWFRTVCAEEMGVDAPGGEASHPLRDWLRELNELRSAVLSPSVETLVDGLTSHGGSLAAVADAVRLVTKKDEDYNTGIRRDDYFPLGLQSYAQMVHVKALRLVVLALTPRPLNFESARDTCLDLINYASFCADWLDRQGSRGTDAGRRTP